ncbi:MAG: ABC transporter ATP-binding protein [Deferribacterota bacterium]|nr:ABC transporter ATP-binding protein [Deferribacterota bacterium]
MQETEIETKYLTKNFGDLIAVNNISFSIKKGNILAMLGPNGSGKTTIIKMLTGLLKPTKGDIFYRGKRYNKRNKKLKSIIGVVPQENNIDRDLTVVQNLRIHAMLYNIDKTLQVSSINNALKFGDLEKHKNKLGVNLSGGIKRRLTIARAIMHNPSILFLDEPTISLDPHSRRHLWSFIRKLNATSKTSIFITTHYIEEAELLADEVIIIDSGKILVRGKPEELKKKLGKYTVEVFLKEGIKQEFFREKEEAFKFINSINYPVKIRSLNLEDVYINLTGKRINQ